MDYEKLYNQHYYEKSCGDESYLDKDKWAPFYERIADEIIDTLHPSIVLDVGCAVGYLVAALRDRGVEAYGIDVSEFAISKVREDIRPYCKVCSALKPFPEDFPRTYDLITTIEVAEHLYESDGIRLIENICKHSKNIIFSSSSDDITEKTHYNVQQAEYWAKKFAKNGFTKDLTYDASFIAPQAVMFVKREYKADRLIEDYERTIRIFKQQMHIEEYKNKEQIVNLNTLLSSKEKQIANLERVSLETDKNKSEIEENLRNVQQEYNEFGDNILKLQARIDEFIQASQWLNEEVARWQTAYKDISGSICWRITKPIRLIIDALEWLLFRIKHNILTRSMKKIWLSFRTVGLKNTLRKIIGKLSGKSSIMVTESQFPAKIDNYDRNVDFLLNERFRNIQPIQTINGEDEVRRLNFVTDSIDSHSLLGGVATALIIATEFANRNNLALRIITRTTPANPVNYNNIMRISGVPAAENVTFYSDHDRDVLGNVNFKLEINEKDIFFATSWWSAAAIKKTSPWKNFYYIIQEVETFFYPHGDEHHLCSEIMQADNIYYIVNSQYLYDYFKENAPNIVERGVYFEPAFPKALYQPKEFVPKKKYKLFFYARPNNPRNMFPYGIELLEMSIRNGVLDTNEWDIYCAGEEIPRLKFSNGYVAINMGLMNWQEYGKFLSGVDLALTLMYTPHPSYPPYDVASSGGVVVTNCWGNKKSFDFCKNVILSNPKQNEFLDSIARGIALAKDPKQRKENYENATIPRTWKETLGPTLDFMEEKLNHV